MHTPVEHEVWRQRVEEIRQEAAVARLEKSARAGRGGRYHLMGDTKWELERYAGSLKKRQTTLGLAPCQRERMNDRRVEIREYLKGVETDGPVHEGPEQTHGQGPRVDARVSIRVATPWDLERLRGMFSRASSETIYRRFHLTYPVVPEQMLALMLDPDRHDGGSLVTVAEEEIVGHAMYARLGDGSEAEMAIVVEDGWQSKGVGKSLLFELAQRARLRGVDTLIGQVLGENRRMLGLAAAVFTGTGYAMGDGVCRVCMPLKTPGPAASTAQTHRQVA